jgi:hypothetical protein
MGALWMRPEAMSTIAALLGFRRNTVDIAVWGSDGRVAFGNTGLCCCGQAGRTH